MCLTTYLFDLTIRVLLFSLSFKDEKILSVITEQAHFFIPFRRLYKAIKFNVIPLQVLYNKKKDVSMNVRHNQLARSRRKAELLQQSPKRCNKARQVVQH